MKEKYWLEPGLLNTYRLLSWVLVVISLFQTISLYLRLGWVEIKSHPLWIFPIGNLLILGLLYWPNARKITGRFFVPLLVVLATIGGMASVYLTSFIRFHPPVTLSILVDGAQSRTISLELPELSILMASWQLIPLLFIPLIMVAWQYNFKAVVVYVVGSTLLDIGTFLTILNLSGTNISFFGVTGVLVTRVITFLVVGFLVSQMMAAQRQQRHELRQANQQLLGYTMTLEQLSTTRERNRLARELHDTLAHTLSSLAVQLAAIQTLWERNPHDAQRKLADAIDTTRNGLNETRRALQSLRAAPLEDLGLYLAVQELAKSAADRCGAVLSLSVPSDILEIPPNISQAFYRAAQEGLENIVRHSGASQITLTLQHTTELLVLEINDDGLGFDPQSVNPDAYGLRGFQERADLIGGECIIKSCPGSGTQLIFRAGIYPYDQNSDL